MTKKVALITGVLGQDGGYLAEFLLAQDYEVHGLARGAHRRAGSRPGVALWDGDLSDGAHLARLLDRLRPHEVYNLAALSSVAASFDAPAQVAEVNGLGTLRLLEAIRVLGLKDRTRFFQAGSSELYGAVGRRVQDERTPFHPCSPYAVAKLYAHWITVNYREAWGLFACNGILFNHESPARGEGFVTRKITRGLVRVAHGLQDCVHLGNLAARRDWGHARDVVRAQWLMLQQSRPDDFVVATGLQYSVRHFVEAAARELGLVIRFEGEGTDEVGVVAANEGGSAACSVGDVVVRVDPGLFRPAEVHAVLGDAGKARATLGWSPRVSFVQLVREMVEADVAALSAERHPGGQARREGVPQGRHDACEAAP